MIPLSQQNLMPKMTAAFSGWQSLITLKVIGEVNLDGFISITETDYTFQGIIQPLSPEQIQLKPEGQRSWQWMQIHCKAGSLNLKTNDRIEYNGQKYKVMNVLDYTLNGFIEYHAIQDYEGA